MGVRRAVDIAENALADYPGHNIYTLGPLIHNKTALKNLAQKGMRTLNPACIDSLFEETKAEKQPIVIVRAHGTASSVRKKLEKAGAIVIDATCPRVLVNQKRAADYSAEGYTIFIAGDKKHGEVIALSGSVASNTNCFVLQNAEEAHSFVTQTDFIFSKAALLSQTTITQDEYNAVRDVLRSAKSNIHVFNTICPATMKRQEALKILCTQVDGVLIIGGKNSANTQRLYQSAVELCATTDTPSKPVAHVETAAEIPDTFYALERVGLTAGASTPDEVIDEVEANLKKGMSS